MIYPFQLYTNKNNNIDFNTLKHNIIMIIYNNYIQNNVIMAEWQYVCVYMMSQIGTKRDHPIHRILLNFNVIVSRHVQRTNIIITVYPKLMYSTHINNVNILI